MLGGIEDNPGYGLVVHPPLAKEIMAAGMGLFGYTPSAGGCAPRSPAWRWSA